MTSKQGILLGLAVAAILHAALGYWLLGYVTSSPFFRGFLTLVSFPVAVTVAATLAALVFTFLPLAKVPLSYNFRNLQVRWKTTLITGLAFTLVVALLTVMLAFVKAMDRLAQTSGNPGNVMILADGATDEVISNLKPLNVSELEGRLQALIRRDDGSGHWFSREVYVILNHQLPKPLPGGRQRRFVQMRGVDDPLLAAKVHDITLAKGVWWSETGIRNLNEAQARNLLPRVGAATVALLAAPLGPRPLLAAAALVPAGTQIDSAYEVVIGDGISREFGKDKGHGPVGPGEILFISDQKWYVVGVMDNLGSAFGSEIWTRSSFVQQKYGRENSYSTFVFRTKHAKERPTPEEAHEQAKKAAALVKEQAGRIDGITETDYYLRLSQTNAQFLVAFVFVAVIMAIGGVLGVMNTMFAAISQRAKDIGVMRLLGYSRWQILASFLMESLCIALAGGLLGLALGYLADGWTASSIMTAGPGGGGKSVVLKLVVDPAILTTGLIFTLVMGSVGGFLPSVSAMRLKPLESLR